MLTDEYGFISDLSTEEAIAIFDDLYLNLSKARGCGKTRMLHNYATAWMKIRSLLKEKENNHD